MDKFSMEEIFQSLDKRQLCQRHFDRCAKNYLRAAIFEF